MSDMNIRAVREALIKAIRKQTRVCIYGEFAPLDENGDADYEADALIGVDGGVDFNALAEAALSVIQGGG